MFLRQVVYILLGERVKNHFKETIKKHGMGDSVKNRFFTREICVCAHLTQTRYAQRACAEMRIIMKGKKKILLLTDMPLSLIKGSAIVMLLLAVLSGSCSVVQVYVVSEFVDVALQSIQETQMKGTLIVLLILLLMTVAIDWLTQRIHGMFRRYAELKLLNEYRPGLLKKCAGLKYAYVEQADSLDLVSRVLADPEKRWLAIFQAMLDLIKLFINIAGIIAVIASYVWWAALLILLFCIPLFAFSVKSGKINYQAWRDTSAYSRKYGYLDYVLNSRECLNERRVFQYTERLNKQYADTYHNAFSIETRAQVIWALKTKLSGGLSAIAALLIVITLIQPTIARRLSIGLFISLVNAVFLLTGQMSWGLSRNIDELTSGNEFCRDMRRFWELPEEEGVLDLPKYTEDIEEIEFRHVSFRYSDTEHPVLSDVSFVMKWGKNYALVGSNGAGKTTVIKLLTGLYPDYEGEILINHKELREYSKAEQKGFFAVVYQDFCKHALSFRENCELSNPCMSLSEGRMIELARQFELSETIEELSDGYDNALGKVKENSADLSGGQWQKLAMIRALLRPARIRILDEPTASLDPKMESEIYSLFQQMTEHTLTVLISHRLGFARLADQILVFDGGRICEQGDFQSLMEREGLFYQMYEEQRSWYQ